MKKWTVWMAGAACALLTLAAHAAPLTLLDRATARQLLNVASYRQPTIVALWSSDCAHCKKNMKLLSDLLQRNRQLRVITVAVEAESSALVPILDRNKMPPERYAYGVDNPDALAYALDPDWAGELPRTYLFNGAGHKEGVSGVLTPEMVRKALSAH